MVDKDNFLKKLNQNSAERISDEQKKEAAKKEMIDKAKHDSSFYASEVKSLVSNVEKWLSESSIKIVKKEIAVSEFLKDNLTQVNYNVFQFALVYEGLSIIFTPQGCLRFQNSGLIDILVDQPKLTKVYEDIALLVDSECKYQWFFSDNKNKFIVNGDTFRDFVLKTIGIE
ncbi:TPA: hypothetical protein MCN56_004448 [Klebsiella pneumoniae]|nr:hypothetical protein [Klebsiella pneumoniae]HBT9739799.1 hypothetical protein [Klebsiella pneumoniae]HBU2339076.1 hypothetical protein [Klebsiella pneumoniae]